MSKVYSDVNLEVVKLFIEFQWTYRNMQKVYDAALEREDLSESRFIILMFLKQAQNQTLLPSIIADKLGATRATVSKLLKAMEIKKWIVRGTDAEDKRAMPFQLSEKGNEVLERFLPENFSIANRLLGDLSSEEIQQLSHLLKKINDGTKKCNQEREKQKCEKIKSSC